MNATVLRLAKERQGMIPQVDHLELKVVALRGEGMHPCGSLVAEAAFARGTGIAMLAGANKW